MTLIDLALIILALSHFAFSLPPSPSFLAPPPDTRKPRPSPAFPLPEPDFSRFPVPERDLVAPDERAKWNPDDNPDYYFEVAAKREFPEGDRPKKFNKGDHDKGKWNRERGNEKKMITPQNNSKPAKKNPSKDRYDTGDGRNRLFRYEERDSKRPLRFLR